MNGLIECLIAFLTDNLPDIEDCFKDKKSNEQREEVNGEDSEEQQR